MMIKILQGVVVTMFAAMVVCGILVFLFAPVKLTYFQQLIGILYPIFLAQVIPALIGTPLTEAVRNLTGKAIQPALPDKDDGK